jgi:hypothetical protein
LPLQPIVHSTERRSSRGIGGFMHKCFEIVRQRRSPDNERAQYALESRPHFAQPSQLWHRDNGAQAARFERGQDVGGGAKAQSVLYVDEIVARFRSGPIVNGIHEVEHDVAANEEEAVIAHAAKLQQICPSHQQNGLNRSCWFVSPPKAI